MKIAPEGIPFIGTFLGLLVFTLVGVFALSGRWPAVMGGLSVLMLVLMLFMVYFFRDPDRTVPAGPGYISPADGRVLLVEHIDDTEWVGKRMTMISVFMSPLNVHVNRAPCSGEVVRVKHIAGQFLKAYHKEAPWKNEQTNMVLKCDSGGEILVRQVAGAVARRTVCRVKPGARLERGERYGMIKFSSRVDVYLPEDVDVRVAVGERVYAGQTILAVRPEEAR